MRVFVCVCVFVCVNACWVWKCMMMHMALQATQWLTSNHHLPVAHILTLTVACQLPPLTSSTHTDTDSGLPVPVRVTPEV